MNELIVGITDRDRAVDKATATENRIRVQALWRHGVLPGANLMIFKVLSGHDFLKR